jgi:hypothetical protein
MMDFAEILRREIAKQCETIKRMSDNHPDFDGNGIMGQIRAERLDLLKKLLEFESTPQKGVESKQPDKYAAHHLACITRVTGGLEGPCDCGVESSPQKGIELGGGGTKI